MRHMPPTIDILKSELGIQLFYTFHSNYSFANVENAVSLLHKKKWAKSYDHIVRKKVQSDVNHVTFSMHVPV